MVSKEIPGTELSASTLVEVLLRRAGYDQNQLSRIACAMLAKGIAGPGAPCGIRGLRCGLFLGSHSSMACRLDLQNVGRNQREFIAAFGEHVLPVLRA